MWEEGTIVQFTAPTPAMMRYYGMRVYEVNADDPTIAEIEVTATPPEDESLGMVLDHEYTQTHGSGTVYYKVLVGERMFWISEVHLSIPEETS